MSENIRCDYAIVDHRYLKPGNEGRRVRAFRCRITGQVASDSSRLNCTVENRVKCVQHYAQATFNTRQAENIRLNSESDELEPL